KTVERMHMRAQITPDQPGADGEILAAPPFAGRGLDAASFGRRRLGGQSSHPRYPLALNQATASAIPCRAGRGAYPNSRTARTELKNIFFFDIRAPSRVAKGSRPVNRAKASAPAATGRIAA